MRHRLLRILLAAFCVTIAVQQTNLGSLLFGDECRDNCPDGDASKRCPLGCTSCTCVGHGTPMSVTQPVSDDVARIVPRYESDEPQAPNDLRPDSVFHVPRSLLV